jgi:hypothetical protein
LSGTAWNGSNMRSIEKLLDPKQVGEIIGLRRSKVYRMLATGEIPCIIVAQGERRRIFRVRPSDLANWLMERECRE